MIFFAFTFINIHNLLFLLSHCLNESALCFSHNLYYHKLLMETVTQPFLQGENDRMPTFPPSTDVLSRCEDWGCSIMLAGPFSLRSPGHSQMSRASSDHSRVPRFCSNLRLNILHPRQDSSWNLELELDLPKTPKCDSLLCGTIALDWMGSFYFSL